MDELQGIVDAILPVIQEKTNSANSTFNLWFGGLKLVSLDEEKAIFTTPTKLRKRFLNAKYKDFISEALEELIGCQVEVSIDDVEDEEKNLLTEDEKSDLSETPEQKKEGEDREKKIQKIIETSPSEKGSILDEYTFENFIEGASNKFAKAVCYAVAKAPSTDYNPLFIHGNSGLGKTHLLCAIINYMKANHKGLKIVYKKCEDFMNELISAISTYSTKEFKEKYRGADVLLIDDIQFIAGKVSTQEEFFHTFSYLYESNKQIILTSDRPPHEIKPLEDRLLTRFEGGLIADIQPPSPELRIAIIRKKSEQLGLNIPNDLVDYMADRLHDNIRQIEGVLKRLHAMFAMNNEEVTKEAIDGVISVIDPGNIPTDILIDRVINVTAKFFGVSQESLKSKIKTDSVANARHVAAYVIRELTKKSYKDIGKIFSRDHTSIMHSCDKVELNMKTKKNYKSDIQRIMKEVKG